MEIIEINFTIFYYINIQKLFQIKITQNNNMFINVLNLINILLLLYFMIKSSDSACIDSDDYLIDCLNQYLKIIRNKLQLTLQLLLYFKPDQQHNYQFSNQKINNRYSELKLEENEISTSFKKIKIMSISQKRTFERFCLRVYQQCQKFVTKLKKNKCISADQTDFLKKIQTLFSDVKNIQGQIALNEFVSMIMEQQQCFKFNSLNKAYNQVKFSEIDIAEQIKQLYNIQKCIKLKSKKQNIGKQIKQDYVYNQRTKQQQTKQNSIFKYTQQINKKIKKNLSNAQSFSINHLNHHQFHQKQQKPICKHCKPYKILDIINIQQVYHQLDKSSQKIMQQLMALNHPNFKIINGWRRFINKKKEIQQSKQKQRNMKSINYQIQNLNKLIIKKQGKQSSHRKQSNGYDHYNMNLLESGQSQKNLKKRIKKTRSVIIKMENTLQQIKEDEKSENQIKKLTQRIANSQFQNINISTISSRKNYLEDMLRKQTFEKIWANVNNQIRTPKKNEFNNQQIRSITQTLVLPKIDNKKRF